MVEIPELNVDKLPMPELARQLLDFATVAYDSRGEQDIVSWSVAIDPATYLLLDRPTEFYEPVIVLDFEFNVQAANAIAGDPIRAKQLYDVAVINAMIGQLCVERDEVWLMAEYWIGKQLLNEISEIR